MLIYVCHDPAQKTLLISINTDTVSVRRKYSNFFCVFSQNFECILLLRWLFGRLSVETTAVISD